MSLLLRPKSIIGAKESGQNFTESGTFLQKAEHWMAFTDLLPTLGPQGQTAWTKCVRCHI